MNPWDFVISTNATYFFPEWVFRGILHKDSRVQMTLCKQENVVDFLPYTRAILFSCLNLADFQKK